MKKRSLKKLAVKKATVSKLNARSVNGGEAASQTLWRSIIICVDKITNEYCDTLRCQYE